MKKFTKEELETISYDDLAYEILLDNGKKMKIQTLFKKVCDILSLSEKEFEDRIADFFELLSTDKRFIMLTNGYWDLRINHSPKVIIIDDDEDDEILLEESEPEEDSKEETDFDYDSDDEDEDDEELNDLVVVDPENDEPEDL